MKRACAPPRRSAISLLLLALFSGGLGAQADPMTDEEVVRSFVAGRSTDELIAEIERREPDFDVSPEMLDELRAAGLPATLIETMVRRQREAEAAAAPDDPPEPTASPPLLRVFFAPERPSDSRPLLSLPEAVPAGLAAAWNLADDRESRVVEDVAMYLACRTPEHVPDHWRSRSPLGRDFASMPRHRLLGFVAGARRTGEGRKARLELEIPATIEGVLEPGVPHRLLLGIALQVAGRYRRVLDDEWPEAVLEDRDLELDATVEQARGEPLLGWTVRFEGERTSDGDVEARD